ncbi:SEC-C metal-binding domain-containing protein [Thiorhodococcus mannitoliphagus]|uniref:SEC-C metal-binding domain-containing protein n=1 Tax=Thiorhodococcus mannitoliphagus TaxID=329406 RepID=UPI0023EFA11E|nr:SEC-C metal-binding domain-containing protein [Thiorhodococcus mannitoliphagus]
MSKVGRNDPCPCGSGKKYKKCCLAKDEKKHLENTKTDDIGALFEDSPIVDDAFDEIDLIEDFEESPGSDVEPYVSKTIDKEMPEIDEEEQALVEAWWSEYDEMAKDPDQVLHHLHAFFQAHPDLVENLGVEEALFELGAKLIRLDRTGDYIEFLKHLRQTFPATYLKHFAYFDRDIIAYSLIEQGSGADIQVYLELFKEYPDADPDFLFGVINFLMVSERDETLVDLLEAIYDPLIRSTQVIGGDEALDILVYAYCTDYLDRGGDRANPEPLIERLKALRTPLREHWYDPKSLETRLDQIVGDLDASFLDSFRTTKDVAQFHSTATLNFMGWLHREKGFSWMKAQFYRQQVLWYLLRSTPRGKRPRQPFTFTKQLVDQTLAQNAQFIFSMDPTKALGSINAMYWFGEYLAQRDFISAELGADLQRWCEEMWKSVSTDLRREGIEGKAFKVFPS